MKRKTKWGGPRPGSGRKPLPAAEKRTERIMISITPEEKRELESAAGSRSVSSLLYDLVKRYLARRRK